MNYMGDYTCGSTVHIYFNTFTSDDPAASATITDFANTDVHIHKGVNLTQRNNAAGVTVDVDVDGITGTHSIEIDTSDNTVSGFYVGGQDYFVRIEGATVDGATGGINAVVGCFSLENRNVAGVLAKTTIATLSSQTSFTLTTASADDDAYNNCTIIVSDLASNIQKCVGRISDYTGSTKTVTLAADPGIFTMAAGDNVQIIATSALANVNAMTDSVITAAKIASNAITSTKVAASAIGASQIASNAITAAKIATDAITAAKIAADAIGSSELAATAVTEIADGILSSTARGNLEDMYDGTGYTDDTAPASRAQLSGIGSSGASALNYPVAFDNTTTDTIDNAAAVDKGDGTVGIPVTGHAFTAGREVTIAGSTNYNDSYTIVSQTTNEVVITETYAAETFAGTETIVSSIETVAFTGTQDSGTYATTESNPSTYHTIGDTSNEIDIIYAIDVGDTNTAVSITINAYLTSSNDSATFQVYDHVGDDWETFGTLSGTNGSTNTELVFSVFGKHTSPIGTANAGEVYLRVISTGGSTPTLFMGTVVTAAVASTSTMGYEGGQVWANEGNGTSTGTTLGIDGTFANQCDDFDNAQTIADALGTSFIHLHPGTTTTLSAALEGYVISSTQCTIDGGTQDVGGTRFNEGVFQGTFTRSSGFPTFADGRIFGVSSVTFPQFAAFRCSVVGTLTLSEAANQSLIDCQAGGTATIDCGSLGSGFILNLIRWAGNVSFTNLAADAVVNLIGDSAGTVTINGSGGTVNIFGLCSTVTDSSGGSVTINDSGMDTNDAAAILADTNELQGDWANGGRLDLLIDSIITDIAALNDISTSDVNAQVLDVLNTDTFAEPTGVPAATTTLATKLGFLYMMLRNRRDVSATKLTVYDDGDNAEFEYDLSDDGTTFSQSEANAV